MKVAALIEIDQEEVLGTVVPRVAATVGSQKVTSFASSFDRRDIECTLGEVVTQAIEKHYRGWAIVRDLFKPPGGS